jgi:hypothetical protein
VKTKIHSNEDVDLLLKAASGLVLFWLANKLINKLNKNTTEGQVENDPSVGQAQGLRQAINPSGNNWMKSFDGTDTKGIFAIAGQITDLEAVRIAYKKLYNSSLYEDLQAELTASDYQKFLGIATKGKAGNQNYAPTRVDIPPKQWVITTSEAYIRKTPVKESKFMYGNNIIKLASKGKILGATTGKFVFDEKNDTVYIEFWTLNMKYQKKLFYVAKSRVELLSDKDKIAREKQAKFEVELLEGVEAVNNIAKMETPTQRVISTEVLNVFDENFKFITKAVKGLIMGFPIMSLDTGKGKYLKIKTVEGKIRWIKADKVVIQDI